jgi:hypothetical protein
MAIQERDQDPFSKNYSKIARPVRATVDDRPAGRGAGVSSASGGGAGNIRFRIVDAIALRGGNSRPAGYQLSFFFCSDQR